MKKLLTILGAVGLLATTGATVVACGKSDTNPGDKPIHLSYDDIVPGIEVPIKGPWGFVFVNEQMREKIEKTYNVEAKEINDGGDSGRYEFILKDDLKIKIGGEKGKEFTQEKGTHLDLTAGFISEKGEDWKDFTQDIDSFIEDADKDNEGTLTIKIYSINDKKEGNQVLDFKQADTTLDIKFVVDAVQKVSLANLDIESNEFVINTDADRIHDVIQAEIAKQTKNRALPEVDYTISKIDTSEVGKVVTVEAASYSKFVTGKIEFTISKFDLSHVKINDIKIGTDLESVKTNIQDYFDSFVPGTRIGQDYTITGNTKKEGVILVEAAPSSELLSSSLEIKVLEVKNVKDFFEAKDLKLGEFENGDAAQKEVENIVNKKSELKDKVDFDLNEEAKTVTVSAKIDEETLVGEVIFTYELALPTIKDIKISDVVNGMKKADVEAKIADAIKKIAPDAKKDTDYTVSEIKDVVETNDKITVTAVEDSKVIKGTFSFTVQAVAAEKFDISVIKIEDLTVGTSEEKVRERILEEIKKNASKVTADDYEVKGLNGDLEVEKITVTAKEKSEFIIGSFDFYGVKE